MLTSAEFEQFVDRHLSSLKTILANGTDQASPIMAVMGLDSNGEKQYLMMLVAGMPEDIDDRLSAFGNIGRELYAKGLMPLAVAFASEGWQKELSMAEQLRAKPIRPKDCLDRQEVVMVQGMDFKANSICYTSKISRDKNNLIVPAEFVRLDEGKFPLLESIFKGFFMASYESENAAANN